MFIKFWLTDLEIYYIVSILLRRRHGGGEEAERYTSWLACRGNCLQHQVSLEYLRHQIPHHNDILPVLTTDTEVYNEEIPQKEKAYTIDFGFGPTPTKHRAQDTLKCSWPGCPSLSTRLIGLTKNYVRRQSTVHTSYDIINHGTLYGCTSFPTYK